MTGRRDTASQSSVLGDFRRVCAAPAALVAGLRRLYEDRTGAAAIEYAVIAGFLSIAIASIVFEIGAEVVEFFVSVREGL